MHLTAGPTLNNSPGLCYFLNDVPITPKEAKMVRLVSQDPCGDALTAADFVDLGEVKRVLEKVCANAI